MNETTKMVLYVAEIEAHMRLAKRRLYEVVDTLWEGIKEFIAMGPEGTEREQ